MATWVGVREGRRGNLKAPMFPRELWNVHERALDCKFLTNNNAEVFHGNYRAYLVQGKHPTMHTFVEGLHSQQRLLKNDIMQLQQGAKRKEKPVTVARTEKLKNLCVRYNESGEPYPLLDGVAQLYLSTP